MSEQVYCTLAEIVADLNLPGVKNEATLVQYIRAASDYIQGRIGDFMPVTATRYFKGTGHGTLWVPPLLSITSIVNDPDTLTTGDYILFPRGRWWRNGPYTRLEPDPDSTTLSAWVPEEDAVVIAGTWGLYDKHISTGATVSAQTDSATALVVSNAAEVSPGAVLLIGTEQELVTATGAATDSTANTAEALDNAEEEVDVDNGTLVNAGEIIRVDYEQMKVLAVQGNTLVVARAWNGTKAAAHTTSADVYVYRTFTVERAANGTTAAAHSSAAIERYVAPADVNFAAREMAGIMLKKAQGGWAGKVGNANLGEVFYVQEFPEAIEKIGKKYVVMY